MTDVLLERTFNPGITPDDVLAMAEDAESCFQLRRVSWQNSLLSSDGGTMTCWFRGPDAESARSALRMASADIRVLWPCTVHDAPGRPGLVPNVLVTRSFPEPVQIEDIQAIEDAAAWCLDTHRVTFVRTFFSFQRSRMICLYHAPDAESVRLAQRQAGMPMDEVWSFQPVLPYA